MLTAKEALNFVERIEAVRAAGKKAEAEILSELRAAEGYETNQDRDILEAVKLRAEARATNDDADTLINSFDWEHDGDGGVVRKDSTHAAG